MLIDILYLDLEDDAFTWLEFLTGAALLAAYLASRWSAPRVWLLSAPVLALTMWFFFENFVRLLPATL